MSTKTIDDDAQKNYFVLKKVINFFFGTARYIPARVFKHNEKVAGL